MLKENLKNVEKEARQVIDKFIEGGDLHGYRRFDYKGDSECYVCLDSADPWIPVLKSKGMSIVGNTVENLVLIADAIKEHEECEEYCYLIPVRVRVKARNNNEGLNKAVEELKSKGIDTKDIIAKNLYQ